MLIDSQSFEDYRKHAVTDTKIIILHKESCVVPNRATCDYSYSVSSIRTNTATAFL